MKTGFLSTGGSARMCGQVVVNPGVCPGWRIVLNDRGHFMRLAGWMEGEGKIEFRLEGGPNRAEILCLKNFLQKS